MVAPGRDCVPAVVENGRRNSGGLLPGIGEREVIMMSQNRAEARDRLRAENDYKINLKAELEIRHLHEKIDHLLRRQYNRLFEIQQIQIELLEELGRKRER